MDILATLDANGDGRADLAAPQRIFLNNGAGSLLLTPAGDFNSDTWDHTKTILSADLDGDGDDDLVVGNAGRQVDPCVAGPSPGCDWEGDVLCLNDGSGSFTRSADGDKDLLPATGLSWPYPVTMLYRNDGQGVFSATDLGAIGQLAYTRHLAVLDADGDGDMDIAMGVAGDYGGYPDALFYNDGDGNFTRATEVGAPSLNRETEDLAVLDADGDTDVDIIVTSGYGWGYGTILLLNDGAGHFAMESAGDFDGATGQVAILDADSDGDNDIFAHDSLYLNENIFETGTVVSPVIRPSELYPGAGSLVGWDKLQVQEDLASQTVISYDVLDPATGNSLPGYSGLSPSAAGQINLAGINTVDHPAIRLRANLAHVHSGSDHPDSTPYLCGWEISFALCYDYDGDGAVRIADIQVVAGAWGTENDDYDFNGNGVVDVGDIQMVADQWNSACSP